MVLPRVLSVIWSLGIRYNPIDHGQRPSDILDFQSFGVSVRLLSGGGEPTKALTLEMNVLDAVEIADGVYFKTLRGRVHHILCSGLVVVFVCTVPIQSVGDCELIRNFA